MSSDDAAHRQDDLSFDDMPEPTAEPTAGGSFGDPWGGDFTDPFADPASANLFSAEIENVNASDWDVEAERIWGDDADQGVVEDGGGLDFPL